MKKLVISTAVFAALSIAGTTAQAYQFELNGGAGYSNVTTHNTHEHDEAATVGGSATVYLKNVDTKTGPLAEAAFINQASSITAGYAYGQTDGNSSDAGKNHVFNGGGEFYIPTSLIGLGNVPVTLYAAGGATRIKTESVGDNGFDYSAEVGLIPNKLPYDLGTLLLTAGVTGSHDNQDKELDPTVRAKLLTKFYQNDINLEAHAQFGGNNKNVYGNKYNIAGFSADFYADSTFSVGGGYDRTFIAGKHDPFNVNLNARKFIMENVSVQAGIDFGKSMNAANELNNNDLTGSVGATLRF